MALGLFVGLQAVIALTGNYAFFNLLSASLCLFLLDDEPFGVAPASVTGDRGGGSRRVVARRRSGRADHRAVSALALTARVGIGLPVAPLVAPVADLIAPLRSVNAYGLFAVMTTTRPEIIVEGSEDGVEWKAYEFAVQTRRPPPAAAVGGAAPAAAGLADVVRRAGAVTTSEPWFDDFCRRLLSASPDVLRLLARDPFGGRPPRFVRATLYRYRFSDRTTGRAEGVWWTRERLGDYSPVLVRRHRLRGEIFNVEFAECAETRTTRLRGSALPGNTRVSVLGRTGFNSRS